ncbi:MAG: hypothetical protein KatS3mg024_1382 [Armatimonadota bacterium]|nr:MAG: hypothetical protein KatS3mg024_1382 [Armatimonadota bacterium]
MKEPSPISERAGVRPRAYLLGVLCVVGVCVLVGYGELVASRGGSIDAVMLGSTHLPPGAMAGLFVLLFGNAILRRFAPWLRLTPAEIIAIYFMMVCAAPDLIIRPDGGSPACAGGTELLRHSDQWLARDVLPSHPIVAGALGPVRSRDAGGVPWVLRRA